MFVCSWSNITAFGTISKCGSSNCKFRFGQLVMSFVHGIFSDRGRLLSLAWTHWSLTWRSTQQWYIAKWTNPSSWVCCCWLLLDYYCQVVLFFCGAVSSHYDPLVLFLFNSSYSCCQEIVLQFSISGFLSVGSSISTIGTSDQVQRFPLIMSTTNCISVRDARNILVTVWLMLDLDSWD